MKTENAVLGGGCFWCTEAIFNKLKGVISTTPGYAGGTAPLPSYTTVSQGSTGHAEVIKIEFNPQIISYKNILAVFFNTHDPTTKDRQGADVGNQYRSLILTTSKNQDIQAKEFIAKLNSLKQFDKPIVTTVKKLEKFYPAEDYHQDYYQKNSSQLYCQLVIKPKLEKLRHRFAKLLKT